MNLKLSPQIAELKAQWDAAQPLSDKDNERLWEKLRLEWNYNSNHIEGNKLTYGQTQRLILHGEASGSHVLRDYEEMKAHDVAIAHVRELAVDTLPITESDVRNLNQILLKEAFWKAAKTPEGAPTRKKIIPGQYKVSPNNVQTYTGEIYHFSSPEETPPQMAELLTWFREQLEVCESDFVAMLAVFHHRFSRIHPFDDGNGRTMRLLVNYALIRNGFPPIVIKSADKETYLSVLHDADEGNIEPFVSYLKRQVEDALNLGLKASHGDSLEEPADWQKQMEIFVQEYDEGAPLLRKSAELVRGVAADLIIPVADEVVRLLSVLKRRCPNIDVQFTRSGFVAVTGEALLSKLTPNLQTSTITINFKIDGFPAKDGTIHNVKADVAFKFNDFDYVVTFSWIKAFVSRNRYNAKLTSEQIASLSSDVAKHLFYEVKKISEV